MPAFDENTFLRPWIEGVAVVANLVSDAVFDVGGVSGDAIEAAILAVTAHDRLASADLRARLVAPASSPLCPSGESSDWVDGVSDAMCRLAATIDFGAARLSPFAVAIVGLPVTRNEWDARADVDEVSRLVSEGMGLTVASCWPAPGTISQLADAARAKTILALPDGRAAARVIAGRTGASVVDVDLPLGFDGTVRFMTVAGSALGRAPRTAEYVQTELRRVTPRFEWVVPHSLLNRRIGLVGDATFVSAMFDFLGEVGCDVCCGALTGGGGRGAGVPWADDPDPDEPVNLIIGNSDATAWCAAHDLPFLEMCWPCRDFHAFYPKPGLGFNGAAAILQDAVNRMNIFEILGSWKNTVINEEDLQPHTSQGHVPAGIRPV